MKIFAECLLCVKHSAYNFSTQVITPDPFSSSIALEQAKLLMEYLRILTFRDRSLRAYQGWSP